MVQVRVQLASAAALLERLNRRLEFPEDLLAPALPLVARAIERNFDEEGRPLRWAPLAPDYARRKARRFGPGLRILQRSGRLRRSIVTRLEAGAIVASTNLPYAAAHQFGVSRATPRGSRFLPARPFLVLTESDKQEIAQAVADSLSTPNPVPGTSVSGRRSPVTAR